MNVVNDSVVLRANRRNVFSNGILEDDSSVSSSTLTLH